MSVLKYTYIHTHTNIYIQLQIDGLELSQSQAMVRYLAKRGGMCGSNGVEETHIDMVSTSLLFCCALKKFNMFSLCTMVLAAAIVVAYRCCILGIKRWSLIVGNVAVVAVCDDWIHLDGALFSNRCITAVIW